MHYYRVKSFRFPFPEPGDQKIVDAAGKRSRCLIKNSSKLTEKVL